MGLIEATTAAATITSSSMKVHHQFPRAFWDHQHDHHHHHHHQPSLSLGCKRLRPLAPKLSGTDQRDQQRVSSFDLKSFIRPDNNTGAPRKQLLPSSHDNNSNNNNHHVSAQVESQPGGTRWNPTQEQIGILEMLYRGGMRTPNAQQIEQITAQLGKYGKIEGKNVFYWFQNHKARERQKQKRSILALAAATTTTTAHMHTSPRATALPSPALTLNLDIQGEVEGQEQTPYKRKCRSWTFEVLEDSVSTITTHDISKEEEGGDDKTLELFPLHPEGR